MGMDKIVNLVPELRKIENNFHQALKNLIEIPSVNNEYEQNYRFGKNIDMALKKTLDICEQLGFSTYYDPEGYYGYADIGEGSAMPLMRCLTPLDMPDRSNRN
jgi:succinyl-diaminopimelate desuccinylase